MTPSKMIESPSRRNALGVLIATALAGCATEAVSSAEPEGLVADARTTLSNFIRDPDQTWIQDNLNRARALLIAPQVVRAGFIFGGSGGRGVLVARDGRTWAGPAFYNLATASVGFQAGIDVSEVIIVVMTDAGFNSLLSTSVKIGGASIAAGPVGAGARSTVTVDLITRRARSQSRGGREYERAMNDLWRSAAGHLIQDRSKPKANPLPPMLRGRNSQRALLAL
jgi:lipid-binding SYLF domain-containing protein